MNNFIDQYILQLVIKGVIMDKKNFKKIKKIMMVFLFMTLFISVIGSTVYAATANAA